MRSSSAASDPTTEKLECFLDHRSLLGMLQQRPPLQEDPTALHRPRHPLVGASFARPCLSRHVMCLIGPLPMLLLW